MVREARKRSDTERHERFRATCDELQLRGAHLTRCWPDFERQYKPMNLTKSASLARLFNFHKKISQAKITLDMKEYEKRINKQKQMDKQKSQNRRYFFLLSLSLINQKKVEERISRREKTRHFVKSIQKKKFHEIESRPALQNFTKISSCHRYALSFRPSSSWFRGVACANGPRITAHDNCPQRCTRF